MTEDFIYKPNFITKEQECEIMNIIPQSNFCEQITMKERNRVFRYGSLFPYNSNFVDEQIPSVFNNLGIEDKFDSVTINEYLKDQQIKFHTDLKGSGERIAVLSLLGYSELTFRKGLETMSFLIEPLSLYIMEGDLRWNWEHSSKAKQLRYSVVFRYSGK